ncbi:hypothetical protein [Actinoplanes solisilvae]|uniref:hypothetical protein n=1 Tax=Actinoplanes solisilvae TaxID=2486853 RepID=UPI000FDA7B32|nr:hypothetical protein [Actinoplanes solisilvae]
MSERTANQRAVFAGFVRDLIVNILGNIVAAAGLFLLATGGRLITRNEQLIRVAGVTVAIGAAVVLTISWAAARGGDRLTLLLAAGVTLGGVLIALGLLTPAIPLWLRAVISLIGLAITGLAATSLLAHEEPTG